MACLPYYKGISFPLNIFFFLINIICSLVSIIGNSLTIFSIKTKPQLQSPSNWLLAGLSLTDLLAGVIAQPMYGTYLAFFDYKNNCVLEKSIVFMSATSCSTSLLHLCVIARDRYVHISKAMHSNEYDSGVKVLGMVAGCWITGLIVASTFMIPSTPESSWTEFLGFATFSFTQVVSFVYIVITYVRIQRIISSHFKRQRQISDEVSEEQARIRLAQERSHNRTLMMLIVLFVIVWFPFMVVLMIGTAFQAAKKIPGPWMQDGFVWTAILTYVNGAINPFIYAARYRELGQEIKRNARKIFFCFPFRSAAVGHVGSTAGHSTNGRPPKTATTAA